MSTILISSLKLELAITYHKAKWVVRIYNVRQYTKTICLLNRYSFLSGSIVNVVNNTTYIY